MAKNSLLSQNFRDDDVDEILFITHQSDYIEV